MENRLKTILSDILNVEAGTIHPRFGPADSADWDSMNNLRLVTAIEEEFKIRFSMDEITQMTDFSLIVQAVGRNLQQAGG